MAKLPSKTAEANGGSWGTQPTFAHGQMLADIGSTGLRAFGGYVREDFVPNLTGRQGATVYREMLDSSPIVGAVMFAIQGVMRKVEWRVNPVDESPEAAKAAEFVDSLRFDMDASWEDFITEALSMLGYGYSVHEIVYKRRNGPKPFGSKIAPSKYDDGLIGWRRLPIRSQDTVLKWFFDENGATLGLTQQPWIGPLCDLPMEKCMLFRPSQHKGNPEGRALDPETLVPTPDGWRTMDDLQPGDKVFDEQGRIRYVTARADWEDRPCFRVTFGDGCSIIADAAHQWATTTLIERSKGAYPQILDTSALAASVKTAVGSSNHAIEWAGALDYPEQILPLDPYFLGLWLGDGTSLSSSISCHVDDAEETVAMIEACGYQAAVVSNGDKNGAERLIRVYGDDKWDAKGPQSLLTALGLKGAKHVPEAYLRGSASQRLALLAGMMDSDGHADNYGRCEFVNTNMSLIYGVAELVRSLGCAAKVSLRKMANGIDHMQDAYVVRFRPNWSPFRLARKVAKARECRARDRHYVASVEPVEARRTVCIEVDSPSHLFLAGENMVPTHNSILRNSYRPYYFVKRLEEGEAIMIERMAGNVIVRVPTALLDQAAAGVPSAMSTLAAYKNMATRARTDEQMGLLLPSDTYMGTTGPTAVRMFDYEYVTPQGGSKSIEPNTPIVRHKLDIMSSVLCDFIQMGHTNRGAQNLADTKVDLFMQAVEGWLNAISAVLNQQGVSRLWALNGMDPKLKPEIVPDMAQQVNLDMLGNFILALSQSGAQLFPDDDLEAYIRDVAGLPDAMDGASWRSMQEQDQNDAPVKPDGSPEAKKATAKAIVHEAILSAKRKRK